MQASQALAGPRVWGRKVRVLVARARLLPWKFDLALLDLNLPEGEGAGWNLLADIDALEHPPPVVVFSGCEASPAERRRVAAVLVKGRTSNCELLEAIERVLHHDAPRRAARAPANDHGGPFAQVA